MRARKLTEILLAIVAVWQLIETAPTLAYLLSSGVWGHSGLTEEAARFSVEVATVQLVVSIAVNAAVLIWRGRIAQWIVSDDETVPGEVHEWQGAAFAVVGVYFVVHGASGAAAALLRRPSNISWAGWEPVESAVIQVVLGCCLFLGTAGLSRLWRRLRTGGESGTAG